MGETSCLAGVAAVGLIYHGFGMIPTSSGPVPGVNVWKTVDFAGGDIDVIRSGFGGRGWGCCGECRDYAL